MSSMPAYVRTRVPFFACLALLAAWGSSQAAHAADVTIAAPAPDDWHIGAPRARSGLLLAAGRCSGGSNAGASCTSDSSCTGGCSGGKTPGAACTGQPTDCRGGCTGNTNVLCSSDVQCAGLGLGKCSNPPPGTCTAPVPGTCVCNDGNPCTNDSGTPAGSGCVYQNNTLPCDDGDPCTVSDVCAGGACQPGAPANCDDGSACTSDLCLANFGCVHSPPCNDGNACTDDVCNAQSGQCQCVPNNANACSDGNVCTSDTCVAGQCVSSAPSSCSDGNGCTLDTCDPETGQCGHRPSRGRVQRVTLAALRDNSIYQENPANSNGGGLALMAGRMAAGSARRSLLAFDVAGSIPAGVAVRSVNLALHCSQNPTSDAVSRALRLQRLGSSWGEAGSNAGISNTSGAPAQTGDATWTERFHNSLSWTSPGGDYSASPSAASYVADLGVTYYWGSSSAMVADVQSWLDTPASNFGWAVIGDETAATGARALASREAAVSADRPLLTVEYVVPDAIGPTPGQVPDAGAPGSGLSVTRQGGQIHLSWTPSCECADSDYAVYEGALSTLQSSGQHALAQIACSTGGMTSLTFASSPGSKYYLVSPLRPSAEGSLGQSSSGAERVPTTMTCRPRVIGSPVCATQACYFNCSQWDPANFGTATGQAPPLVSAILRAAPGSFVGVPGHLVSGSCRPDELLPGESSNNTPPGPPPLPSGTTQDTGVGDGSIDTSYELELAYRYACMANGQIVGPGGQTSSPPPYQWQDPVTHVWYRHRGDIESEAEMQCAQFGDCQVVNIDDECTLRQYTLAHTLSGEPRTPLEFDPNQHVPTGFWGRQIVAELPGAEETCKVLKALDKRIATLTDRRWGIYASYGGSGGAGGGARLSGAYLYDMSQWESAAYIDAGVNIGFHASLSLAAARGIAIGLGQHDYGTIHNFYGGTYVGANAAIETPIVKVGVGAQICVSTPAGHPFTAECSVSFGVSATPGFEVNATTGVILPVDLGTARLQGITGGWVNVFSDSYGNAMFDGIGPQNTFGGNYSRMRNAPAQTLLWKGGSVANSAVRFAGAPDIAAFAVLRATAEYSWGKMRALCGF